MTAVETAVETAAAPAAPAAAWRNRIVGSGEEAPDRLLANPANWRSHPPSQEDAMTGALGTIGWVQQVIVNRTTGHLVDGHLRADLARRQGAATVPVLYVDLSEEEERLVLASLDPLGAMANANRDRLAELLSALTPTDTSLERLLKGLATENRITLAPPADPDEVPETPAEPYVKPGELYVLGDHRLLCGDATNPQDVARLLDGGAPTLLATDPPYGVQLDQTWRDGVWNNRGWATNAPSAKPYMMRDGAVVQPEAEGAPKGARRRTRGHHSEGHRNTAVSGDTRADWSEAFALVPSLTVGYVWHASAHMLEVLSGLLAIGFEMAQQVIWDKGLWSMSRQWYHWQHEPCMVVRKPGIPNLFIGDDRSQSTIWRAPSPKRLGAGSTEEKYDHPMQKPVLLFETPIRNHLRRGGAVYDPFVGSGTCLIAAETQGVRCYAMEIDPKYVQVVVERWQTFTGKQAVRDG